MPEVVNLVLFKLIRSKTKFWQILGRDTRLCRVFGPGAGQGSVPRLRLLRNLEYFRQNPKLDKDAVTRFRGALVFAARFDLVRALDEKQARAGN